MNTTNKVIFSGLVVVVIGLAAMVSFTYGRSNPSVTASSTAIATVPSVVSPVPSAKVSSVPKVAPVPKVSVKTVYVQPKVVNVGTSLSSLGSKPCAALFSRGVGYN